MESFEEVYQKYLKEVYCFLLRLSGDREIAEELTQQTFAIAFEKLENFRGECKLSVWLCQIAKHEYYAWTKKQKRYANKLDENHADQGEDLLNGIINQENGQIILRKASQMCLKCQSTEDLRELKPGCFLCGRCLATLR